MIRAGKLVHPIGIERVTVTAGDAGEPVETWASVATVRAEMIERKIVESATDHGTQTTTDIAFRIRYFAWISLADRIVYAGRSYDLVEIEEPRAGRELVLKVRRIGP